MPNIKQTFSLPTPFEQQVAEANRRQKLAELMQQEASTPLESQMVSGRVVPTSPLLALTKMLQGYMGGKFASQADEQRAAAEQTDKASAMDFYNNLTQGKQTQVSPDQAMEASMSPTPTEFPARQAAPTGQARESALMQGMIGGGKRTQQLAQLMLAQKPERRMTAAPIKAEDFTPESFAAALKTDDPSVLVQIAKPEKTITPYESGQLDIARERLEFDRTKAGQRSALGKPPSGFRYSKDGDLEAIPGGPNDVNAPKPMPSSMISANIADASDISRFSANKKVMQNYIDDIESGKLPLGRTVNLKYQASQAASGLPFVGSVSDEADKFFGLQRAVKEQVNAILNLAKGPQTDQDARRAQDQILNNLNDPKIVSSALRRLQEIYDRESGIRHDQISERNQAYGRVEAPKAAPQPPAGFIRPGGQK